MALSFTIKERTSTPIGQLWFGMGAGPILWAVHLMVVYFLTSLRCQWQLLNVRIFGISGLVLAQAAITLIFTGIIVYAGLLSYRNWQRVGDGFNEELSPMEWKQGRVRFMALSGVLLSALFSVLTLVPLYPILTVRPCV